MWKDIKFNLKRLYWDWKDFNIVWYKYSYPEKGEAVEST